MVSNYQPIPNDLNRLMAAAVIDRDFCNLLLSNPVRAIDQGYYGEFFQLPAETQSHLGSISAASLSEFAQKIISYPERKEPGHWKKNLLKSRLKPRIAQNRHLYDSSV